MCIGLPHSKGYRAKTRSLFSSKKVKGLSSILYNYKPNDSVVVDIDPRQVKGMPHRRFHGLVGTVEKVWKRSLIVNVQVGGKVKKLALRVEHIKPHKGGNV